MNDLLPQKKLAKLLNVTSGALTQARQQRRRVKGYRIDRWAKTGPNGRCRGYEVPDHVREKGGEPDTGDEEPAAGSGPDPAPAPEDGSEADGQAGSPETGRVEEAEESSDEGPQAEAELVTVEFTDESAGLPAETEASSSGLRTPHVLGIVGGLALLTAPWWWPKVTGSPTPNAPDRRVSPGGLAEFEDLMR